MNISSQKLSCLINIIYNLTSMFTFVLRFMWTEHVSRHSNTVNKRAPLRVLNALGGFWRCDCRARRHTQRGQGMESQPQNLHGVKLLLLSQPECHLWGAFVTDLGPAVCLFVILAHLGHCALHKELSNWVQVSVPTILAAHKDSY